MAHEQTSEQCWTYGQERQQVVVGMCGVLLVNHRASMDSHLPTLEDAHKQG